jgi:hypothetical protein
MESSPYRKPSAGMPSATGWPCLFARLREFELPRLQKQPNPWRVIDRKRGVIDLSNEPCASHRRLTTILPVLSAWLRWMNSHAVPFHPLNHWEKFRLTRATVLAHRYATPAAVGRQGLTIHGTKVYSMARRSYISCRLALTGVSCVHVSEPAGTTERFVRAEFYRKAAKEEARKYFSLMPKRV